MVMSGPLSQTLQMVAEALSPARHDWWIIASAACALHGVDPGQVGDVDVLIDERDVGAVLAQLGLIPASGTSDGQFRSRCFVSWQGAPLTVEFFAGFELCERGEWDAVRLKTRELLPCGQALVPVPSRSELAELLRRFGRPKDLERAKRLNPSGRSPSRSGSA